MEYIADYCSSIRQVPKGLEIGIGTMARKEKAVIYVRKQYLTESPLMPILQDLEEVHFEVELLHFIQVEKRRNLYNPVFLCSIFCI